MSDEPASPLTLSVQVTGRVQGVSYRAWTRDEATGRDLSGWVRNMPDGSVRALLHGPADRVRDMVGAMRHGPPAARVDNVRTTREDPPDSAGFRILR